jgi:hypothetical protein
MSSEDKKSAEELGKYALELLAGFALFPLLIVLILVLAVFVAVPTSYIGYSGVVTNNPVLIGIAVVIVLTGAVVIAWLIIKILRRVSDSIWNDGDSH